MIAKLSKTQKNATHQGTKHQDHDHKQLINLFPLHPENQQDKLDEDDNMASIFSSCEDATLTGILCSKENDEQENENNHSHSSVNYADEEVKLVRTAMRRTKTVENDNEGKWVCFSEVVERSSSSSTSSYHHCDNNHNNNSNGYYNHDKRRKLILKLDYEKLMKLWVNKGPLFLHGDLDQPQTVPDLQDDDFFWPSSNNVTKHDEQNNGGSTGLWTVPETNHYREASVQRYKDKRRNRLFHKTVRYEVRKLNAQKRPRIRGRFVEST